MFNNTIAFSKHQLDCGAEVVIAIPTGGFGHAADEQPLPYIKQQDYDLTPRFGGDESFLESGYDSLPLPKGKLTTGWPFKQSLFNFYRRRINIYWRNVFKSFNNHKPDFMFARQLNFKSSNNGFIGICPIINFKREFKFGYNVVEVSDFIEFKSTIKFEYFNFAHFASFTEASTSIEITTDKKPNQQKKMTSSSGKFQLNYHKLKNIQFKKGDLLTSKITYRILSEL